MKTKLLVVSVVLMGLIAPAARAADDLHVIYEEGRAYFNAGQWDLAREKLLQVAAKNPAHVPTRAMLAQIQMKLGADNTALRKTYQGVIIEKIEFSDAALEEAVEAVRILSKRASAGKIVPNIIIKDPELGKKQVSLNLSSMPLSEVLNYLAKLAGAKLIYDKNAVMFASHTSG
jgi:tetratricopeptide (TPR) repeat protein